MKAVGIVRKIDELGRVVIPKEIRRTLRLTQGSALEIYVDSNRQIVFRKYSPLVELSVLAKQIVPLAAKIADITILVCDLDHITMATGAAKNEYIDKKISAKLEEVMQSRRAFIARTGAIKIMPVEKIKTAAAVVYPIVASGDVSGAVIMLQNEKELPNEAQIKLVEMVATFLSKQLEE